MNRLALGTVQFGLPYGIANQVGQIARSEAKAMLQLAAINGIDTLDTAIAYGESEMCLGAIGTQGFNLVTKLPAVPEGCDNVNRWVQDQLTQSFARLAVDSVYGVMLHRPEQLLDAGGDALFQALQNLKASKQVQKIGISVYGPAELDALIPKYCFDIVQVPFNLVDQRMHRSGWLQRLKDRGVEIHTRSSFLQGLLLMPESAIPAKFSAWSDLWRTWHGWLADNNVSAVQASLAFSLSFPEIDRVVVGADSVVQLGQIIDAATAVFSYHFPDLHCDAEALINPARWSDL